ncbi:GAD-like domain-containing protein [Prevotella intermedia]|uniref:GAD-like domain-containing protein n=1 Tax=Prevotella intermedia TaxID=28131 RepID=UPI000BE717DB|nr:GAD-like domain-containing protein [Prevotella intermedia]PDP67320.1 glutamyl-tRNA amidotransferase [Prevotella intermedia]
MTRITFEERNINNYTKYGDVSIETINKYKGILPDELLSIWQTMGYGVYEDGFLQLVNPDEYEFVFDYIDKLLEPSIVFGITALGDLLIWEGNKNKTIASDEGNRVKIINIRSCKSRALDNFRGAIDIFFDDYFIAKKDYFDSKAYLDVKDKLPKLQYGQCYGYVPALALGGKASNKNLQVVDAKTYIDIVGQAVGKIIDLSD